MALSPAPQGLRHRKFGASQATGSEAHSIAYVVLRDYVGPKER